MRFVVEGRLLTDVGGTIGASVLSTPGMIGMIERNAADPRLREPRRGQGDGRLRGLHQARRRRRRGPDLHGPREAARGRRRAQAALRRRGQGGRPHDRRRHPRAPRDRGRLGHGRPGQHRLARLKAMAQALPESVRIREVGPRDGFQNEPEVVPTEEKVRLIGLLGETGLRPDRAHLVRAARCGPAAGRRRRGADALRARRGGGVLGPDPEPEGARERARVPGSLPGGELLPLRLGDPQPQERQPLDRRLAGRSGGNDRRGRRRRAALRGRDLDQLRLPLRGRGRRRSASSRSPRSWPASAARRSPSATRPGWRTRGRSASSSPPPGERLAGGGADGALPQHPRPGPRERARRARAGDRLLRELLRRAGWLPGASGLDRATSRPRTSSRCWRRWASGTGVDLPRLIAASTEAQKVLGRPLGAHLLTAGPVDWQRSEFRTGRVRS